jgi:hypothetical protein
MNDLKEKLREYAYRHPDEIDGKELQDLIKKAEIMGWIIAGLTLLAMGIGSALVLGLTGWIFFDLILGHLFNIWIFPR